MHKKNNVVRVVVSLSLAVAAASALAAPDAQTERFHDFWSPGKLDRALCRSPLMVGTPLGLPRCMQAENILSRLESLQNIATSNGGNRASGQPGYQASVDYVRRTLERAGYRVQVQPFPFLAFYPSGPGMLASVAPQQTQYVWEEDFTYLEQTDPGSVTAPAVAVDVALGAGNTSTSGCEAEDFANFPAGAIALVQRGTCTFGEKATNAANAGAAGVIIFNQGDTEDRKGLMSATLGEDYAGGIPVLFATYDNGATWAQTEGLELAMTTDVVRERTETYNVVAETRRGNPDNVVMVGAHLDSVFEGPGINDNGSGSATLLEMAVLMGKAHPLNKVRFAWWGAEESGLVGSTYYVNQLTEDERGRIKAYLNADMVGSPNFANFIYDGDGSDFGLQGPPGSAAIERLLRAYFDLRNQPSEGTEIDFRSDYAQFFEVGIPFGGLFTGAEGIKSEEQAQRYGGAAGQAYDPCYHSECDDLGNISREALELHGDALAFATSWLSLSTKAIDDEIAAAANQRMLRSQQVQEKSRWGHWIR
ncbi:MULTISPECIES: M28 family metallopeptidase [Stutzerimonas]|uniref:M28 family metallopeptidase n=1 Tax=Stutzerimonas TaxID=2901164 RepID=UPI00190C9D9B|nr:M28 family metallopeptidase [Stutzerimonas balearica]MBK3749234.1 M28 family peptidase [Stutzerimonas balearica]MBK3827431.1 M28 family peptidase [Stutzerimonas balearica]MBK3857121.1 M28 family peptidase [Stutzerimonas balearica]